MVPCACSLGELCPMESVLSQLPRTRTHTLVVTGGESSVPEALRPLFDGAP